MEDISSDLEQFDDQFKPGSGQRPGAAMLPDGEYDFRIVLAETARTTQKRDPIVRFTLQVLTDGPHHGSTLERIYFLATASNIEILGSDLVTLGIDADLWKGERKFSKELALALPKLTDVCFRGTKKTNTGSNNKTYHNIYVNERISRTNLPPLPMPADRKSDEVPF